MFEHARRLTTTLAIVSLSASALLAAGCGDSHREQPPRPENQGCAKDTDCKGDRICQGGQCVEDPSKKGAGNDSPKLTATGAAPPTQPANADPYAMGNDGLPATIPLPGSQVPTLAEWNAVPREITLKGSGTLGCETKMLREWLRVSCRLHGDDHPIDVKKASASSDVQVFVFQGKDVSSLVTQVVKGREVHANFAWDTKGNHWGATLDVTWPSGNPRPTMTLTKQ